MSNVANERVSQTAMRATEYPRRARKAASAVAAFMNYVAGWNFILCAVFITVDVICRNFGGFSSKWYASKPNPTASVGLTVYDRDGRAPAIGSK